MVVVEERATPEAVALLRAELDAIDRACSRFRADSELSWANASAGRVLRVSRLFAAAVGVALRAAERSGGAVDPTVESALVALGYDRDFAAVDPAGPRLAGSAAPAPGWRSVRLDGPLMTLPADVGLDLGATAKGLGSDRAVRAVMAATGGTGSTGGVLVSLGGDLAVAGPPPSGGWPILVADEPEPGAEAPTQLVRLAGGALATSSISCRQWRRGDRLVHHIVDPRTGLPADGPWRTATVAGPTCADANAAATAAIVAGDRAEEWLAQARVPARLVARDGHVRRLGGWPDEDGAPVDVRTRSRVYDRGGPVAPSGRWPRW